MHKTLNLLHVVAHTSWGADQQTLLHLYRSLIRSKLHRESKKGCHPNHGYNFCQFLVDLQNSFTVANSSKFPTKPIVSYPPHLQCVAVLPYLQMLDPIQNHALRLCLGAYRTSPACVYLQTNHLSTSGGESSPFSTA